ncbi:eight-cysteine-cluster domain-containing protein [Candidatus Micrarchaeota archaeon]|nr:eight-cysteine-cluster domain-containing protein [Candidatus Micrarchaeota archaeon]
MKTLIGILLLGMMLGFGCIQPPVACTMEAKLCPDGSYVGRVPPDCEFEECPQTKYCDAMTVCESGDCYAFEDKDTPICYTGDPCARCASGRCMILESYPMQIRCTDGETPPAEGFCGSSTDGPCSSDADCMSGGCSGQVCQSKSEEPVVTTCEYRECYNAAAYGLSCGCVGGNCEWN